jgi:RNA 3'-terminal phosphate cyclase (ATP)
MIEIDGSVHSGSGTLLRCSVALATLMNRPLHITNIRIKRPKPGLRAQHLQAVKACAEISGGTIEGAEIGSREILYWPGTEIKGGVFHSDIGTAGSATMAALVLIPLGLFAKTVSTYSITGGLFQDFAPTFFHMRDVLLPILADMGARVELKMIKPGYVPRGGGVLELTVYPLHGPLRAVNLDKQGSVETVRGTAISSHLGEQNVSQRLQSEAARFFASRGFKTDINIIDDDSALQKGAALAVHAQTDTGCVLGADQAGKPGRRSEHMARFVFNALMQDLESGATVDRHIADQLVLFAGLARGTSEYVIHGVTDHVDSNLFLVEKILGAGWELSGKTLKIHGVDCEKH